MLTLMEGREGRDVGSGGVGFFKGRSLEEVDVGGVEEPGYEELMVLEDLRGAIELVMPLILPPVSLLAVSVAWLLPLACCGSAFLASLSLALLAFDRLRRLLRKEGMVKAERIWAHPNWGASGERPTGFCERAAAGWVGCCAGKEGRLCFCNASQSW